MAARVVKWLDLERKVLGGAASDAERMKLSKWKQGLSRAGRLRGIGQGNHYRQLKADYAKGTLNAKDEKQFVEWLRVKETNGPANAQAGRDRLAMLTKLNKQGIDEYGIRRPPTAEEEAECKRRSEKESQKYVKGPAARKANFAALESKFQEDPQSMPDAERQKYYTRLWKAHVRGCQNLLDCLPSEGHVFAAAQGFRQCLVEIPVPDDHETFGEHAGKSFQCCQLISADDGVGGKLLKCHLTKCRYHSNQKSDMTDDAKIKEQFRDYLYHLGPSAKAYLDALRARYDAHAQAVAGRPTFRPPAPIMGEAVQLTKNFRAKLTSLLPSADWVPSPSTPRCEIFFDVPDDTGIWGSFAGVRIPCCQAAAHGKKRCADHQTAEKIRKLQQYFPLFLADFGPADLRRYLTMLQSRATAAAAATAAAEAKVPKFAKPQGIERFFHKQK